MGIWIWDEHWWTIGFWLWPIAKKEPRGCPSDVEVNNDLLRSGGPPPPARGAPREEFDAYIRKKWAAKLRDQDDQGRAKAWVMFFVFCFFFGCFKSRCLPQNLDVWDWSKTMWISTNKHRELTQKTLENIRIFGWKRWELIVKSRIWPASGIWIWPGKGDLDRCLDRWLVHWPEFALKVKV